jgi:hypothetical protein
MDWRYVSTRQTNTTAHSESKRLTKNCQILNAADTTSRLVTNTQMFKLYQCKCPLNTPVHWFYIIEIHKIHTETSFKVEIAAISISSSFN